MYLGDFPIKFTVSNLNLVHGNNCMSIGGVSTMLCMAVWHMESEDLGYGYIYFQTLVYYTRTSTWRKWDVVLIF